MSDERKCGDEALLNMHKAYLNALRHREQDIVRFVLILVSTLGGFVWLFQVDSPYRAGALIVGTYGVFLVFLVGAFYALTLGYNYRYLTLQVSLLEHRFGLKEIMMAGWPGGQDDPVEDVRKRCLWGVIPCCTPPEIVKYFWLAFVFGIALVTPLGYIASGATSGATSADPVSQLVCFSLVVEQSQEAVNLGSGMTALRTAIPWVGTACFLLAALGPVHFGRKMLRLCDAQIDVARDQEEPEEPGE